MQGVYSIRCIQENKIYIGSSRDIENRWKHHKWALNASRHHNSELQLAWDAYGDESFIFSVLEETSMLEVREQEWLNNYLDVCYNTSLIVNNCMANPDTIEKRKQTIINNNITRGRQKLTKKQVYDIKYAYVLDSSVSAKSLAEIYGVHKSSIERILSEKSWKDVKVEGFIPKVYTTKSQEVRNLVVEMYNNGSSMLEIKKATGYTSNGSIYDIIKRQKGLKPNRYAKTKT
jgi:predicted DNA-binding protein YlxM (UPF0122 family)